MFDWIGFGITECETCLFIMYVGYSYWSLCLEFKTLRSRTEETGKEFRW